MTIACRYCGDDVPVPEDDRAPLGFPAQSGAMCCSWECATAMDAPPDPEPRDLDDEAACRADYLYDQRRDDALTDRPDYDTREERAIDRARGA